jgi:YggT family protein
MVLDAVSDVQQFVDVFLGVYLLVILLLILTSWIRLPYSFNPIVRFLHDVCDPYLRLWRRILPASIGPLDFSPMAAIFGLILLRFVLDSLLNRLH